MNISQILGEDNLDRLLGLASAKFQVGFENVSVGTRTLKVLQIADLESYIDRLAEGSGQNIDLPFWARIWPASVILSYYVSSLDPDPNRNSILEAGCGIGLAGLFAAARGFKVTLTDNSPDALLFTRINILKNNLQDRATAVQADFTRDRLSQKFDCIIGSEITYLEDGQRGLRKFLLAHLNHHPLAEVILTSDYRRKARKFFKTAERDFLIEQKNIGAKGREGLENSSEKFLCTIYRM